MRKKSELQFDLYVSSYDFGIDPVRYKHHHCFQVEKIMGILADRLKLSRKEKQIAMLIGLLHDIGRFEQAKLYNVCSDTIAKIDHADQSVVYLFDEGHIKDFIRDRKYDSIIRDAIKNHNKFEIDKSVKGKNLFFSKMIRDADKIDIYRVVSEEMSYVFNKDDVSKKVLESFRNHETIKNDDKKKKSDAVVSMSAFVYDINFKESFDILKELKNLDKFYSVITPCDNSIDLFNEIKDSVYKYVNERGNL